MSEITFDQATLQYEGNPTPTIDEMNLNIQDGEFIALVGPSGSGKSTTLRMVAGLESLTGGEIYIGGKATSELAPSKRDVAMVFQSYALYPHMTVADNMGFALKMKKVRKDEREKRVQEAAKLLDLEKYLDRYPKALSGGQRQRVAMGRAIVRDPQVFLMDEPLSNLDAKLRVSTRTEIRQLQRRLGTTMMYVTHDQTEAMTMADRIAVLEGGILQQVGTPEELYKHPVNAFVATFIGSPSMNMAAGVLDGDEILGDNFRLRSRELAARPTSSAVTVGIRPENLELTGAADAEISGTVDLVENFGSDKYLHVSVEGNNFIARVSNLTDVAYGETVHFRVDPQTVHLFDGETEGRIVR